MLKGIGCDADLSGLHRHQLVPGVQQSKTDLTRPLTTVSARCPGGLQQVLDGLNGKLVPGAGGIADGIAKATGAALKGGNQKLRAGLVTLKARWPRRSAA